MRYLIIKNKKLFKLFYKQELTQLKLKYIALNCFIPKYIRQEALLSFKNMTNYVKLKQRCFITNKSRSILNHFKISRIKLRLLISNNYLNGVKKLSW